MVDNFFTNYSFRHQDKSLW